MHEQRLGLASPAVQGRLIALGERLREFSLAALKLDDFLAGTYVGKRGDDPRLDLAAKRESVREAIEALAAECDDELAPGPISLE